MTVDSPCPLTCPHGSPATCQLLNPPSSLRQIAPVRSGKGLLHHFNCCAVCVHQGNSRDSKLNSDMQFIQERRPIERLSAEPPPPTLEAEICCCQWYRAPCLSPGTEAPGDRGPRGQNAPWTPGQLHSHFAEGVAEPERRVLHMGTGLGTPRPGRAWVCL